MTKFGNIRALIRALAALIDPQQKPKPKQKPKQRSKQRPKQRPKQQQAIDLMGQYMEGAEARAREHAIQALRAQKRLDDDARERERKERNGLD